MPGNSTMYPAQKWEERVAFHPAKRQRMFDGAVDVQCEEDTLSNLMRRLGISHISLLKVRQIPPARSSVLGQDLSRHALGELPFSFHVCRAAKLVLMRRAVQSPGAAREGSLRRVNALQMALGRGWGWGVVGEHHTDGVVRAARPCLSWRRPSACRVAAAECVSRCGGRARVALRRPSQVDIEGGEAEMLRGVANADWAKIEQARATPTSHARRAYFISALLGVCHIGPAVVTAQ
eukprot:1361116-Pleurochrysis_carterae.AAC.1